MGFSLALDLAEFDLNLSDVVLVGEQKLGLIFVHDSVNFGAHIIYFFVEPSMSFIHEGNRGGWL